MSETMHSCRIEIRIGERGPDFEEEHLAPLVAELETSVDEAEVGELDGEEFDGNWVRVTFVGPDADELHEVIEAVLAGSSIFHDAKLVKRYGAVDDPEAEEVEYEI